MPYRHICNTGIFEIQVLALSPCCGFCVLRKQLHLRRGLREPGEVKSGLAACRFMYFPAGLMFEEHLHLPLRNLPAVLAHFLTLVKLDLQTCQPSVFPFLSPSCKDGCCPCVTLSRLCQCRNPQNKGNAEFVLPQFVTHHILLTYSWKYPFQISPLAYYGYRFVFIVNLFCACIKRK